MIKNGKFSFSLSVVIGTERVGDGEIMMKIYFSNYQVEMVLCAIFGASFDKRKFSA